MSIYLTGIRSEISKIRVILWVTYTYNVERLGEVEKIGRQWIYFVSLTKIIREKPFY